MRRKIGRGIDSCFSSAPFFFGISNVMRINLKRLIRLFPS